MAAAGLPADSAVAAAAPDLELYDAAAGSDLGLRRRRMAAAGYGVPDYFAGTWLGVRRRQLAAAGLSGDLALRSKK